MPRRYSAAEIARALGLIGFRFVRQKGSHQQYRGQWRGRMRLVTLVARQRQVPASDVSEILKQAALSRDELESLIAGGTISE